LIPTPQGSLALILTAPDQIQPLWLNDFTQTQLIALLQNDDNTGWFNAYTQQQQNYQAWHSTLDHTLESLWAPLIAPLVEAMQTSSTTTVTLIPTELLSLLPLHAVRDPQTRRYALDHLSITYAPNAQSLTAARAIADRVQADSILAVDNPRNDLPASAQEVQAVISTFLEYTVLSNDKATVDQVRSQLLNATTAHFSCHGIANLDEPLASGLFMSDGLLTLKDIFALNLVDTARGNEGLRLAVLSSCETGMIGTENADEAISLPTGLLQAGVAAVIASLWAVDDRSTMLLLTKFYDLWRKDGLPPDQALRQAQIWLRDSTAGEIAAYGGFFTPTPDDRPYAHPFYWAAFSYTGV
ncbi:CHAT domain-containing protein, partial [Nodosilinea sp. LEGE 07298]|uniref:CHAT domain-containing protein n=1 Tax=Nodosilinea sp. LEGE 07298 TaxID=2777970 RepID=UPI0018820C79